MSILITTVVSVFIFGLVVMIHELGHFICAKKAGIQVNEFSIGMGPALFSRVKNGTRYSIRALPVGGYVSMEGEDEELSEEEQFSDPEIPPEAKTGLPFPKVKVWKRIIVVAAGAVMNLVLGFVVLLLLFSGSDTLASRTVALVEEGSAVEASGLQVGDTIVAVNGRRCFIANDIIYEFARTQQGQADLTVLRDGKRVQLDNVVFDTYEENGVNQLVIDFKVLGEKKTVGSVLKEAGNWTLSLGRMVVLSLTDLITGRIAVNNLSGPVGIVSAISEASSLGLSSLLMLLALITINLGIFNLLPNPALDGGRLVFLIIEAIRRRPISQK